MVADRLRDSSALADYLRHISADILTVADQMEELAIKVEQEGRSK